MYGINPRDLPPIDTYQQALDHFNKITPVRGRKDGCKPIGSRRNWNKRMRLTDQGDVVFTLFKTDVVTYHKDGSITLCGHETMSTGVFTNYLLPTGFQLHAADGVVVAGSGYYWLRPPEGGRYKANPDLTVYACRTGDRIKFECRDGQWHPAPGQTLPPIKYCELDRDKARELNKRYRLGELRTWVKACQALEVKIEQAHSSTLRSCYDAAREGDFAAAAAALPRICRWDYSTGYTYHITDASYTKVRTQLYRDEGAVLHKQALSMPWPEYYTVKQRRY